MMGKTNEGSNPTNDEEEGNADCSCCSACASNVCSITTLKWVVAVAVSLNLLVFVVLSFPISGKGNGRPAPGKDPQVQIEASFRLHKPVSAVTANIPNLESAIWEEIAIPYAQVTVISVEPVNAPNSTEVIFGVLPDSKNTSISSYGLISLKETFITLLLGSYNISLASEALGFAYFFQMLKFPGGITIIPKQSFFPLQPNQVLFNFTLHSTVAQVVQNLAQMKNQLKIGLFVRPNENLFVQLTNLQGSTVDPPIIVETFIVPVVGKDLTPPRLRQLAHEITPARNLGLNHTLFGKVKQIQLSSYLRYPSTPPAYHVLSPAPVPAALPSHSSLRSPPSTRPFASIPPSKGQCAVAPSPDYSGLAPIHHHFRGRRTMAPSPHDSGLTPIHHHHAMSPLHHHSAMPPYHHRVGAPSYHHPLMHCDWHHASDRSKCGHQHAKHAPVSGLNGAPSPSPDNSKSHESRPFRHHHDVGAAPGPLFVTSVPPAISPQYGPPKAQHRNCHLPSFPLASPAPSSGFLSRGPAHSATKSSSPAPEALGLSPHFSFPSPEGLTHSAPPEMSKMPHSAPPEMSRMPHPELPERDSPVPAFSYVSASTYGRSPVQWIIVSLVLTETFLYLSV